MNVYLVDFGVHLVEKSIPSLFFLCFLPVIFCNSFFSFLWSGWVKVNQTHTPRLLLSVRPYLVIIFYIRTCVAGLCHPPIREFNPAMPFLRPQLSPCTHMDFFSYKWLRGADGSKCIVSLVASQLSIVVEIQYNPGAGQNVDVCGREHFSPEQYIHTHTQTNVAFLCTMSQPHVDGWIAASAFLVTHFYSFLGRKWLICEKDKRIFGKSGKQWKKQYCSVMNTDWRTNFNRWGKVKILEFFLVIRNQLWSRVDKK